MQLTKIEAFNGRRRAIAARLDDGIGGFSASPQRIYLGSVSSHHLYAVLLDDPRVDREELARALVALGVEVQLRYLPVHLLPEWRSTGSAYGHCPVTEDIWFRPLVNLPMYPMLSDRPADYMIEALARAYWLALGNGSVHTSADELARVFDVPRASSVRPSRRVDTAGNMDRGNHSA